MIQFSCMAMIFSYIALVARMSECSKQLGHSLYSQMSRSLYAIM